MMTTDDLRSEQSHAITFRTRVSIWVIMAGLVNFVAFAVVYYIIDGEAVHGEVQLVERSDGTTVREYYLFDSMRPVPSPLPEGRTRRSYKVHKTSRAVWIYSGIHATSIWVTMGGILLAMLTLAKDRIVSSMRSAIIRGRTFITIVAAVITVACVFMTVRFTLVLIDLVNNPAGASVSP